MKSIPIVDDQPTVRQMGRRMLAHRPYEFLDLTMPELDGWAVLCALRAPCRGAA